MPLQLYWGFIIFSAFICLIDTFSVKSITLPCCVDQQQTVYECVTRIIGCGRCFCNYCSPWLLSELVRCVVWDSCRRTVWVSECVVWLTAEEDERGWNAVLVSRNSRGRHWSAVQTRQGLVLLLEFHFSDIIFQIICSVYTWIRHC